MKLYFKYVWRNNTWKASCIQVQQCDKKACYLKVQEYNKNQCAVDEKLRRDNFKYTQCNKQRQGKLQYTEKATSKSYLKTMTTMQEYPEEFIV